MTITVILCTYNRCRTLLKALNSLALSELPGHVEWEVLVVDNNSGDQTNEMVKEFCRKWPGRFRYIFERQPGKSHALNTGIRQAKGQILAFVDDDVTVEPTWLWNLTRALGNREWAGAGGRILPEKSFVAPRWLALDGPYKMGGILALFDLGSAPGPLEIAPFGTNMAFRREIFEKYGDFRTDLGPAPGNEIRNEDTEFGRRVMSAGERLRYEPSAVVYHEIPKNRVNKSYFLRWWFDYGRAQIREVGKRPSIFGVQRHYISIPNLAFSHLPRRTLLWLAAVSPQKRFFRKCMLRVAAGWLVETGRLAKSWNSVADPLAENHRRTGIAAPSGRRDP
jgi:glucosyl-dolichyl phosphate glucuronosyltransferase